MMKKHTMTDIGIKTKNQEKEYINQIKPFMKAIGLRIISMEKEYLNIIMDLLIKVIGNKINSLMDKLNTLMGINILEIYIIFSVKDKAHTSQLMNNKSIKDNGQEIKNKELHKSLIKMVRNIMVLSETIIDKEIIVYINGKMEQKLCVILKIMFLPKVKWFN
jgi:hypothetical protein